MHYLITMNQTKHSNEQNALKSQERNIERAQMERRKERQTRKINFYYPFNGKEVNRHHS